MVEDGSGVGAGQADRGPILVSIVDRITTVTLNRPEVGNAINGPCAAASEPRWKTSRTTRPLTLSS